MRTRFLPPTNFLNETHFDKRPSLKTIFPTAHKAVSAIRNAERRGRQNGQIGRNHAGAPPARQHDQWQNDDTDETRGEQQCDRLVSRMSSDATRAIAKRFACDDRQHRCSQHHDVTFKLSHLHPAKVEPAKYIMHSMSDEVTISTHNRRSGSGQYQRHQRNNQLQRRQYNCENTRGHDDNEKRRAQ